MTEPSTLMHCPTCEDQTLETLSFHQGKLERCPTCSFFLVEQKTLAALSEDRTQFLAWMEEARALLLPMARFCPRCYQKLSHGRLKSQQLILTLCSACQSLWIDFRTLRQLDDKIARTLQELLDYGVQPTGEGDAARPSTVPRIVIADDRNDKGLARLFRGTAQFFNRVADNFAVDPTTPVTQKAKNKPVVRSKVALPGSPLQAVEPTQAPASPLPEVETSPTAPGAMIMPSFEAPTPTAPPVQAMPITPVPVNALSAGLIKQPPPDGKSAAESQTPPEIPHAVPTVPLSEKKALESILEPTVTKTPTDAPPILTRDLDWTPTPVPLEPIKPAAEVLPTLISPLPEAIPVIPRSSVPAVPLSAAAPTARVDSPAAPVKSLSTPKTAPPVEKSVTKPARLKPNKPGVMMEFLSLFKPAAKIKKPPLVGPKVALPSAPARMHSERPVAPVATPLPLASAQPPTPLPEPAQVPIDAEEAPSVVTPPRAKPFPKPRPARIKKPRAPALDQVAAWLPRLLPLVALVVNTLQGEDFDGGITAMWMLVGWAGGTFFRLLRMYPFKKPGQDTVQDCLARPHLSLWHGVPVSWTGRLTVTPAAKGAPPVATFSDASGEVPVNRTAWWEIAPRLFGISDLARFAGEELHVKGWYRGGAQPYVELAEVRGMKTTRKSLTRALRWVVAAVVLVIALVVLLSE